MLGVTTAMYAIELLALVFKKLGHKIIEKGKHFIVFISNFARYKSSNNSCREKRYILKHVLVICLKVFTH